MLRKSLIVLGATLVTSGLALTASADPTAEDAYDYRGHLMTTLKGHIGAASMIVRGLVEDNGYLLSHAAGLANGVAEIHRVFQEGSAPHESEALPAIWEQPEKFSAAMKRAEEATANFRAVVTEGANSEAIGAAFKEVGMSCRGCHDDFRAPHSH